MRSKLFITTLLLLCCISSQVFAGGGEDIHICKFVAPKYPRLARVTRIQGTVRLKVGIDEKGVPVDVADLEGHTLLVPAAKEAVEQWRFRPASRPEQGRQLVVTIRFILSGKGTSEWAPTEVTFQAPDVVELTTPPSTDFSGGPDVVIKKPLAKGAKQ